MARYQPKWPACFTYRPTNDTEKKAWLADDQNMNFGYWRNKRTTDRDDWKDLEWVILEIVGLSTSSWVADRTKAVSNALQQQNMAERKHTTELAIAAVKDQLHPLLLPGWNLRSAPNAAAWLEAALKAVAPRLIVLCRQRQGRLTKSEEKTKAAPGPGTAPPSPPDQQMPSVEPEPGTRGNKRPQRGPTAQAWKRPDTDNEEREHKPEGVQRNVHLRAFDRHIIVRVLDEELPILVGLPVLRREQFQGEQQTKLTHVHLCWETFSTLIQAVDERYNPLDAANSLKVGYTDPESKEVRTINTQFVFQRAVGRLGYAAGDRAYIEMTLS